MHDKFPTRSEKMATKKQASKLAPQFADLVVTTETPSRTTRMNTVASTPNQCFDSRVVDVSGIATTGTNGQLTFKLSKFICPAGEIYGLPINVLATPKMDKPFFLTVQHKLVNSNTDVEITVFAWDPNGARAPGVQFNWRCRVVHPHVFL
jgi:hypothetical protein